MSIRMERMLMHWLTHTTSSHVQSCHYCNVYLDRHLSLSIIWPSDWPDQAVSPHTPMSHPDSPPLPAEASLTWSLTRWWLSCYKDCSMSNNQRIWLISILTMIIACWTPRHHNMIKTSGIRSMALNGAFVTTASFLLGLYHSKFFHTSPSAIIPSIGKWPGTQFQWTYEGLPLWWHEHPSGSIHLTKMALFIPTFEMMLTDLVMFLVTVFAKHAPNNMFPIGHHFISSLLDSGDFLPALGIKANLDCYHPETTVNWTGHQILERFLGINYHRMIGLIFCPWLSLHTTITHYVTSSPSLLQVHPN